MVTATPDNPSTPNSVSSPPLSDVAVPPPTRSITADAVASPPSGPANGWGHVRHGTGCEKGFRFKMEGIYIEQLNQT
jgi:hypothetical protein